MKNNVLAYPIILTEYNDESGHYYVVTSPNIDGLVTDGKTIAKALIHAEDAIATILDATGKKQIEVQDPTKWKLEPNQQVSWVRVDMDKWLSKHDQKTVRRNVTIPEGLNNWAKENRINVSQVVTNALKELQDA